MPILGDLERAVMEVLWAAPDALSVREVHEALAAGRDIAYTTVMTVLDRLSKKGLVGRDLSGRAWLYRPATSRVELYAGTILELLDDLLDDDRDAALARVHRALEEAAGTPR